MQSHQVDIIVVPRSHETSGKIRNMLHTNEISVFWLYQVLYDPAT